MPRTKAQKRYRQTSFGEYIQSKRRRVTPTKSKRAPGEVKFLDTNIAQTDVQTAGNIITSLNIIPEGNGESQRVGRKVVVEAIYCRGKITTSGSQFLGGRIRMILFQDKQTNGSAAAVTDILETATIDSYRNLSNVSRFKILSDQTHTLNILSRNAAVTSSTVVRHFNVAKPRLNTPIEFDNSATTGAITTIRSNNYGILYIGEASTAQAWDIEGNCRLRYCD